MRGWLSTGALPEHHPMNQLMRQPGIIWQKSGSKPTANATGISLDYT